MKCSIVLERVERIAVVRADVAAQRATVEAALGEVTKVRAWLAASEADLAKRLVEQASFPEGAIADHTRTSPSAAGKVIDRSKTLDDTPDLASSLDAGAITTDHVDAVTRAAKDLEPEQRQELFDRCDGLSNVAECSTPSQWSKRVRDEARKVQRDDGIAKLERQRRATSMRTWTDEDGMWCLSARFDPVNAVTLASRLDQTVEALFAEATPDTCPSDPLAKQRHLKALALARLIEGGGPGGKPGRAEFVAVIDATNNTTGTSGGWEVTWPIPVEIPERVLAELIGGGDAEVHGVIVRNGIVLYAPGEMNLGRTTRLASRTQRRALRALYSTCGIPGCSVGYDQCKLHHIIWWRHGGETNLDNLLPVCSRHHAKIHHDGWLINLGPNRELTLTLPDGQIMTTGPPHRKAG